MYILLKNKAKILIKKQIVCSVVKGVDSIIFLFTTFEDVYV